MKILHVNCTLQTGGAEKLLLDSIPIMVKEGHTVDLLLLNGSDSIFLQSLRKLNICNIYHLGYGSVYNILFIFKIRSFFKRYDIVHVHLFPPFYMVAIAMLLQRKKKPLIYTEHNTHNRRRDNKYIKPIEKFIYDKYSKIITISPEVDQTLREHIYIDRSKIALIPNGVDTNKYKTALPHNKTLFFADENSKILIQVSSIKYPKDQATIIRSLKLLPDNVKLLIAGDGPLKEDLVNLSLDLGLKDRVLFLGIRADIPELLKTADIIILSSGYEGLSISSLEALSSERPLVASDVKGIHDVVSGAGVLFNYQDEHMLAKEINQLLCDKKYYNEIVDKCTRKSHNYDIHKMVNSYLSLYKDVLNEK